MPSPEWDAATYDKVSGPQERWGRTVLERLQLNGDETVLDAGCGTGRVTEALLARLPEGHVVALDASQAMLAEAKQRLAGAAKRGQVSFVHADLLALEPAGLAASCPLDAVFSTATFHWVTDHDKLFSNLRALLRLGGQLVAQCGGAGNVANVIEAVRAQGVERAGTWLYATPEETAQRLRHAGFDVVRTWCNPEVATFADHDALVDFLQTVCLREHLGSVDPSERRPFAERVAAAMHEPAINYVRLNIVALAR